MKIAFVSLQFEETATGGGGVHLKSICDQFLKSGQDVTVVSIHTERTMEGKPVLVDADVPYSVQTRDRLTIVRFLIEEGIEQPYVGKKDVELARIKRFAEVVIKWLKGTPEKFDVINLHGHHIIPGYMAKELSGTGPKIVSTIHALETTYMLGEGEFIGAFDGTTEVLGEIREWEAMCRWADHVVVNSPIVRDEFKEIVAEAGANVEKCAGKIMLISSGCTEDFLMSDEFVRHKLENIPECINLVTFCRIDPSKGVEFSIRGAKAAGRSSKQKFCLTIAGIPSSDEYVAQLKKELDDIPGNLEVKFKLLDAISPPSEKKEILDNKHIYLLPTLKEPFGMSLIEASARGNMVVSADTNGPKFMFGSSSGQDLGWGIITGCGVLAKITEDYQSNFAENVGKAITWIIDNWTGSVKGVLEFNKKIRNTWTWESIARQYLELFRN